LCDHHPGKYRVIVPLDPSEGGRYVEPAIDNIIIEDVNNLYRTTMHKGDYINPNADDMLSWRSISSWASISDTGLENLQQRLHELSSRRCVRMMCAMRWIGTIEVREPPTFYGSNYLE
jgi:hypothetical protein